MGPGRMLLHYRLVEKIGEGGMGEVYLADDTKLNRKVALKVLPSAMAADKERRTRFEREAQAVAALNHPNIVTIYSVEEAEGIHFITMELVQGRPLTELTPAQGLPLNQLFEIGIPLADAVATAHEQNITHRDLKPDNVMVGKLGRLKVLDFGLAKLRDPAAPTEETRTQFPARSITQEGKIVGTVAYMSPEQAEGKPVDVRTDVFSLGIMLYEMATGRRPFEGDSPVSTLSAILRDTPPTVSDVKGSLPRHLGRIIGRCLAKDPERRYATAKELRNDLEQLKQELQSGDAQAPVSSPAVTRPSGLSRRMIGAALVAVGILAAIVFWSKLGDGPPELETTGPAAPKASLAILPFVNTSGDDANEPFTNGIHDDLLNQVSKIGALKVISRTSVMEYKGTTKNVREIAEELGVATVLEGSVQRAGDRVRINVQLVDAETDGQLWAETYNRELTARNIFDIQGEIAREVAGALQATLSVEEQATLEAVPTESLEAYELYLHARDNWNRSSARRALEIAIQQLEQAVAVDPSFAVAHADLGVLHSFVWWMHYDRTQERLDRAKSSIDRAFELAPGLPEAHIARGHYYYWGHLDYDQALTEFAEAEKEQPNNTDLLDGIASVQRRQGRMRAALATFKRSLELDPHAAQRHASVGETLVLLREYQEANPYFAKALAYSPDTNVYSNHAMAYLQWKGDIEGAREVLDRADALGVTHPEIDAARTRLEILARDYPATLALLDAISSEAVEDTQFIYWPNDLVYAWTYGFMGDEAKARAHYDAARARLEEKIEATSEDVRLHGALGLAYAGLGHKEDAIRAGLRGVELLPIDKEAWRGAYRVQELAMIYTMAGEPDLAIDQIELLLSRPGDLSVALLKLHPIWDPLRTHPRFRDLVTE